MIEKLFRVCVAACLGLLMASCATMSPQECKVANWREVGLGDGLSGQTVPHLDERIKDCRKAGVAIDLRAYHEGRELGLLSYCRLENAIPLGLSGGSYAGVCPPSIDAAFQQRFQLALAVHDLRRAVASLDDRSEWLERRLHSLHHQEDHRVKEAGSDDERRKIRKAIDDERREIRHELSETDRRLRRTRDELRSAEQALSYMR